MSLHEIAIEAAAKHPDRLAVAGNGSALTYDQLNRRADALAHRLSALGVRRGDRVVLWAEKSPAVVAGLQAVLRLGAAYVPADDAAPIDRVAFLVGDCAARVVLTTAGRMGDIAAQLHGKVGCQDLCGDLDDGAPVNEQVDRDNLAYILYTSGSTGIPKGVCISHGNARAFVDWAAGLLAACADDRFANHAPLTFDLSVLDLYAAFSAGASVHLIPSQLAYAPGQLVDFLHDQQITIWYSVPSALILMMRDGGLLRRPAPAQLRAILFAGEPFPVAQLRHLAGWTSARLLNLYGPTETNVCTFHEVSVEDLQHQRPVPIGGPASGNRVWARQPDGSPCEPDEKGELVVDGPTVMIGYWGQPKHQGPYATGDMARVLKDGSFDYLGRSDHMVKLRGNRVELGEVGATIAAHPDVSEATAVVIGEGVSAKLVAFVVPAPNCRPGPLALRRHCATRLPRYMIPDSIHMVADLPRTRNGKVDRPALISRLSS